MKDLNRGDPPIDDEEDDQEERCWHPNSCERIYGTETVDGVIHDTVTCSCCGEVIISHPRRLQ